MKHARKMVLVDANSIDKSSSKNENTVNNAITSLATAAEFGRDYFGSSAISIAHLDRHMKEILERPDLPPAEKLTLYNQALQRYLFLQRQSENKTPTRAQIVAEVVNLPQPVVQQQAAAVPVITPRDSPERDPSPEREPVTPRTPQNQSPHEVRIGQRNSVNREAIVGQASKYRTNLPRLTPKEKILRGSNELRRNQRLDGYFVRWTPAPKNQRGRKAK